MSKKVHYISGCVKNEDLKYYRTSPSGNDKSDYIKDAIVEAGLKLIVLSALECNSLGFSFCPQKKLKTNGYKHIYLSALGGQGNILLKIISRVWLYINLLLYCVKYVDKEDCILFYNTITFRLFVEKFSWCLRGNIYFEVEELYGALSDNKKMIMREISFFNSKCDGFIFVNDLIRSDLNIGNKPYSVCYGRYKLNKKIHHDKTDVVVNSDRKIISYAGLIDDIKYRDAFEAVKLSQYLSDNFVVSIIGYGTDAAIDNLKRLINNINLSCGKVKVKYDGCLFGDELEDYYSQVSYGLCLRSTKNEYDKYTFPSKVLVYINHGIIPICTRIKPVMCSSISENILFVDDADIKMIARQISLNIDKIILADISILHNNFVTSLKTLFN